MKKIEKRYSELKRLPTFKERFEYLKMVGTVGRETFGFDRYLNQALYTSKEWKEARLAVIVRDNGCDLGIEDFPVSARPIIHHMNPITVEDLEDRDPKIFDPEFLILTSFETHNAIHYGSYENVSKEIVERSPGDTCPWIH